MLFYNQKICLLNLKMSKYAKIYTKNFELLVINIVKCIVYTYSAYEKVNQKKYANA